MDLSIIGKFIAEQRKLKGYTQVKLAEILNVSEKTISKWECGNGFPDTTLMLPLCKALDISANELLSGKKLSTEEYMKQAEFNLVTLKTQQEQSSKLLLTIESVLGVISLVSFMILIFIASYCDLATYVRTILIVCGFVEFIIAMLFCTKIEKEAGFYECANCHNKYIPSYNQVLFSMHFGRTRYMKCPKCHKRSWNKKVINKD